MQNKFITKVMTFWQLEANQRDYAVRNYTNPAVERFVILYSQPIPLSMFKPLAKGSKYDFALTYPNQVTYYLKHDGKTAEIVHEFFKTVKS